MPRLKRLLRLSSKRNQLQIMLACCYRGTRAIYVLRRNTRRENYKPLPALSEENSFGLDFSDPINFAFVLFEQFPDICAEWQKRLVYIQVDEFQDSSRREMKLIDILKRRQTCNLFLSSATPTRIYTNGGGADVSLLCRLPDRTHPGTKTILLEQNYRSTGKTRRQT